MHTDIEKALLGQLERCAIVDILGVIGPSGIGVSGSRNQPHEPLRWTVLISFPAWKYQDGTVRHDELTIRKEVPNQEICPACQRLEPYDVVQVRARVAENSVFGSSQGLLVDLVGKHIADDELNRFAQKLQEPVTFEDREFGCFTLDRRVNWYEAETTWDKTSIRLTLSMDDCEDPNKPLRIARLLWDSQETWTQRVTDCAVLTSCLLRTSIGSTKVKKS